MIDSLTGEGGGTVRKKGGLTMEIAYVDPWDMLSNFCFHV